MLQTAKEMGGDEVVTKSGLMVGLGESFEEIVDALGQLRAHDVQVITIEAVPASDRAPSAAGPLLASRRVRRARGRRHGDGLYHVAAGPLVQLLPRRRAVPQPEPGVGPLAAASAS